MSEQESEGGAAALSSTDLTDEEIAAIQESQQAPDTADADDPEVN